MIYGAKDGAKVGCSFVIKIALVLRHHCSPNTHYSIYIFQSIRLPTHPLPFPTHSYLGVLCASFISWLLPYSAYAFRGSLAVHLLSIHSTHLGYLPQDCLCVSTRHNTPQIRIQYIVLPTTYLDFLLLLFTYMSTCSGQHLEYGLLFDSLVVPSCFCLSRLLAV